MTCFRAAINYDILAKILSSSVILAGKSDSRVVLIGGNKLSNVRRFTIVRSQQG